MISSEELADIYRDLHANPELSYQEHRTAGIVADFLTKLGFEVHTGIGGTGVVGLLRNGDGPTVALRADMDALPVAEETGLPYASSVVATDIDGTTTPVMHACGHDMHVTCLLGASAALVEDRDQWAGTLAVIFQPGEERGGAIKMVDDGFADLIPNPVVLLGQHVAPLPVGLIGLKPGPAFAASDQMAITLIGKGSHGSRPETSVDPIVMLGAVIMRLQTIVSREVAAVGEPAVVTIGQVSAGTKENIIPDTATLKLNVRSYSEDVRERVLKAITRIVRAEAAASGAPAEPIIELSTEHFPVVVNDPEACARTKPALEASPSLVIDPGPVSGSEDVGMLATAMGVPCVYWILGGLDPADLNGAATVDEIRARIAELPANHSPKFAPIIEPTLTNGINALTHAAKEWLAAPN